MSQGSPNKADGYQEQNKKLEVAAKFKKLIVKLVNEGKLSNFIASQPIILASIMLEQGNIGELEALHASLQDGSFDPVLENGLLPICSFKDWNQVEHMAKAMYDKKFYNHIAVIPETSKGSGSPFYIGVNSASFDAVLKYKQSSVGKSRGFDLALYDLGDVYKNGTENFGLLITYANTQQNPEEPQTGRSPEEIRDIISTKLGDSGGQ